MTPNACVKAWRNGKYEAGIVSRVEDRKGYRGSYPYQAIWVEFLDEKVIEFRDFDLIIVDEAAPKRKVK